MDQLSLLMQLAGAVADLIDIQGSSVLVCLENGWDTTAQVGNMSYVMYMHDEYSSLILHRHDL